MSPILRRSSLRHFLRHPWQAALAVTGIALGVAVVAAVDLATGSARRAFELSSEAMFGRATHQLAATDLHVRPRESHDASHRGRGSRGDECASGSPQPSEYA